MTTPQNIEERLKSVKPFLEKEFAIDKIGYFGSFAKGDYNGNSDIDLLVSFNRSIGWKFFDIKDYLETVLERKVDIVTEGSLRKDWKNDILEQVKYI